MVEHTTNRFRRGPFVYVHGKEEPPSDIKVMKNQ